MDDYTSINDEARRLRTLLDVCEQRLVDVGGIHGATRAGRERKRAGEHAGASTDIGDNHLLGPGDPYRGMSMDSMRSAESSIGIHWSAGRTPTCAAA